MKRIIVVIIGLLILQSNLLSQSFADSLSYKLEQIESIQEKVSFLNETSNSLRKVYRNEDAFAVSKKAVELVEQNNLIELYSKTYSYLGLIYRNQSKFNEANNMFNKALQYAIKLDQKTQIAYGYNNLATIERILSNYLSAIDLIYKSLAIFKEVKNLKGEANCHTNLGVLFRYQTKYDKSLEHLEKVIEIRRGLGDKYGMAQAYYLIGETEFEKGNYKKSILNYQKTQNLYNEINLNSDFAIATIYMGFGGAYYELGEYNKALEYRLKAEKAIIDEGDSNFKARLNLALGKIYTKINDYKRAELRLQKALFLADSSNLRSRKLDSYKALANLYSASKNYKKGFDALSQYTALKDSIYSNVSKEEIAKIEASYQTKEKIKENELLVAQLNFESKKNLYLTISFVLLIILATLLYILYKITKKSNKLLKNSNKVKDLLFSIISHDIKNPFGAIINNSELLLQEKAGLSNSEKDDLLININSSTKKVYDLLDNLLNWSQSQRGEIKIEKRKLDLQKLVSESAILLEEYSKNKGIKIINEVSENLFVEADQNTIESVIRNLLNNAVKFSHHGDKVIVSAKRYENNIEIEVKDFGVGISNDNLQNIFKIDQTVTQVGTIGEKGSGLGLLLCKDFIEKNGGELLIDSKEGKGSTFKFNLISSN